MLCESQAVIVSTSRPAYLEPLSVTWTSFIVKVELQMCQTCFCCVAHQMYLTASHVCNQICFESSYVYFSNVFDCMQGIISLHPIQIGNLSVSSPCASRKILIGNIVVVIFIFIVIPISSKSFNRFANQWRRKTLKGEEDTTHIWALSRLRL